MIYDYTTFKEKLIEELKARISGIDITPMEVPKINEIKDGLSIHFPDSNSSMEIAPTIYLDDLYKVYLENKSLEKIADNLGRSLTRAKDDMPQIPHMLQNPSLENLFAYVVNKKQNEAMLKNVPHRDIEGTDLTIIAKYDLGDFSGDRGTFIVTESNYHMFGESADEALDRAIKNSGEDRYICRSVMGMIEGMREDKLPDEAARGGKDDLYVLTNKDLSGGAVVLGYPNVLRGAAMRVFDEEKCYIIPSSIHEVMLLPRSLVEVQGVETFASMVREVNGTQVDARDQLSDHVYFFDGKSLSIADSQNQNMGLSLGARPFARMENAPKRAARVPSLAL